MALRFFDVTKTYGRQRALDGVSLHVRPGDCYGFLGHNGAGKTTAIRVALGLVRPDSGRVLIEGIDARANPREACARLGSLVEKPGAYGSFSGHVNLTLLGRLRGLDRRTARREADRLLEVVGLSPAGDKRVRSYSQGMRQRLGIAQALVGDPPILLLDEPTNGLDPEGIEEMRRLFARLTHDEGRTVLLSSHQLHEVSGLCNRIAILRGGKLLVEARTEALLRPAAGRLRLDCGDVAAAREVLTALGVGRTTEDGTALLFDDASVAAEDVARAIVEKGLPLRSLAPQPPTLEEIYLHYTRGEEVAPVAADEVDVAPPPDRGRRAPRSPVLRVVRHELERWARTPTVALVVVLPAVLAVLAVARRYAVAMGHLDDVESGAVVSHTLVTGFEGLAVGLGAGLPVAAIVAAGLASQTFSGELSRGTLRHLVTAPLGRGAVTLGKLAAAVLAAVLTFSLAALAAGLAAGVLFDFTDVVEVLEIRGGKTIPIVSADELWPVLRHTLAVLPLPLAAYAGVGLLAGAIPRSATAGLVLSAAAVLFLDLLRVPGRAFGFEEHLLSAHAPQALGDTSAVSVLLDTVRFPNDDPLGFASGAPLTSLLWLAVCAALALAAFRRRELQ